MSTLLTSSTSPVPPATPERPIRPHGEFIMAGNLTTTGDPETGMSDSPVPAMPNYARREEVHIMLKKLRDSVSLWKRIPDPPPPGARESVDRFVLPQHTMYVK
ncbi:hypothetical protein [Arthrobacter flavus]|uniref:Uncharacterized protein n=1 Tax=Arthrobacter flavus TaxID=95172 RepID=A0ABW4Q378_9MICC